MLSSNIHVVNHPLVQSKLTTLRVHDLPGKDFRDVSAFLRLLAIGDADHVCSLCTGYKVHQVHRRVGLPVP
jgi:hypothetical protein